MSNPRLAMTDVPQLPKHYRFQWEEAQQGYVLLYPEGMVKLSETAGEIFKRIDGTRTVDGVIQDLEAAYPGEPLREDVIHFLEFAHEHGWIRSKPTE